MQNITNHYSLLWDNLFSHHCIDSILGEKNKDENIASATIQEGKGAKHETLDEGLAILMGQLKATNSIATSGVIKQKTKIISKYCTLM